MVRGRTVRRHGWHALLMVTIVATLAPIPAQGSGRPGGPLTLSAGAYFGGFENPDRTDGVGGSQVEVERLESELGRRIDIDNRFYSWGQQIPTALEAWDVASGRIPMVTWGAQDTLQIKSGALDAWIRAQARRLRDLGAPVFLRFYHEMDGDYRQSIVHSPQDFIDAWRRVYGIFQQEGATNVVWVWCPTAWKFIDGTPWPPDYYPGDAYVDWIAADGYNWYPGRPGSHWRTFREVFDPFYNWAVTMGKPIMLAEVGVQEDPQDPSRKAAWIADMHTVLKTVYTQVQAVLYFDTTIVKGGNTFVWDLRSSQQAFDAWRTMGLDPYFDPLDPDTQPPTVPGKPTGTSTSPGSIELTWPAATDDRAILLTYRVFRDDDPTPAGSVQSSSTTTVTFTDTGLEPGSTHTYRVDASDGANTSALSPPSEPITVATASPPVFADAFDAGFVSWTQVTNLTIDPTSGGSAPPSARAQATGTPAFARRTLAQTYPSLCLRASVDLSSIGANTVPLLKLRTASNASIARIVVTATRMLRLRNDVAATFFNTGSTLSLGWHTLELCATVGVAGSLAASLDDAPLGSWTTNLGTTPIGRIQILEDTAKTFTANVDDVVAHT
jgi:hypothetical protein